MRTVHRLLVALLVTAACSSEPLRDGVPLAVETVDERCGEMCDHVTECGWSQEGCLTRCTDWGDVYRAPIMDEWLTCRTELECTGELETCKVDTETLTERPAHTEYLAACDTADAACEDPAVGDGCPVVGLYDVRLFSDDVTATLAGCLDAPCSAAWRDEVSACQSQVLDWAVE